MPHKTAVGPMPSVLLPTPVAFAAAVPSVNGKAPAARAGPAVSRQRDSCQRASFSPAAASRRASARRSSVVPSRTACSSSASSAAPAEDEKPKPFVDRVKLFFGGAAKLDKQKLAALGTSALLSYGFVSNVNAITLVIISWVTFTKTSGLSPLAPGQWKTFLGVYAALYAVVGNGLRPVRFTLSVAIAPVFDKFVAFIQEKVKVAKPVAFGITVFIVNICGSFSYLFLGLFLTTTAMGLPLFPPK